MKWNPPIASDRVERWVLVPLACVVCSPVLLMIGVVLGGEWLEERKRQLMGPDRTWRPWFAWYPVRLGVSSDAFRPDADRQFVWLEWVERCIEWQYSKDVSYRIAPPRLAGGER